MSDYGTPPPPPPGGYAAPAPMGGGMGAPPDNKMVWSILATIFCCLPFGIVAIIKSSEVNSKWAAGDAAGAQASAAEATKWVKWSVISWAVIIVLYLIFVVGLGLLGAASSSGN
ncbi:MAG TPA: CD225/dispanin family protein [Phycicoccus sp.]|nr:CD225/dispanin family protein [Phycicoccus sp.]